MDKGVETFLKEKAFDFDIRNKSRTYLAVDSEDILKNMIVIYGYFTLTIKTLEFGATLSKSTIKRIDGFSKDVLTTETILLGQLGKNFKYNDQIDGQELLLDALDIIYLIHSLAGSRIVFLECDEHPKLIDFYMRNGFESLQKSGNYLQMIKYL